MTKCLFKWELVLDWFKMLGWGDDLENFLEKKVLILLFNFLHTTCSTKWLFEWELVLDWFKMLGWGDGL